MNDPAQSAPRQPDNDALSKDVQDLKSSVCQIHSKMEKAEKDILLCCSNLEKLKKGMDSKLFCLGVLYLILLAALAACVLRTQISNFQATVLCIITVCATLFGITVIVGKSKRSEDE